MRPALFARALFVGWVALALGTQPSAAGQKPRAPKLQKLSRLWQQPPTTPRKPRAPWTQEVEGKAEEPDVAESMALLKAQHAIDEYLRNQMPRVRHLPDEDYIRDQLVRAKHVEPPSPSTEGKYLVKLDLVLTDEDYEALLARDRQDIEDAREVRIQTRTVDLGRILVALVALLATVAGYVRLEDATKGYYTAWLRLAAVGFLAAVGAGLFLISR
jgi:hypothetical protein